MKVKLQGKWEAEKIAEILEWIIGNSWKMCGVRCDISWARDCADRIRRQVEDARTRKCCATCGVAYCDLRERTSDYGKENSWCGAWTAKAAKCCANCGTPVLACPAGDGQKDVSVCGAWTRAKDAKEGEE